MDRRIEYMAQRVTETRQLLNFALKAEKLHPDLVPYIQKDVLYAEEMLIRTVHMVIEEQG